jgi:hypothetical protein
MIFCDKIGGYEPLEEPAEDNDMEQPSVLNGATFARFKPSSGGGLMPQWQVYVEDRVCDIVFY